MTTRAPKVGDYIVLDGHQAYGDPLGRWRGTVTQIVRVTDSTAWYGTGADSIKANRSKWLGDPWYHVVYVAPDEAERWAAANDAMKMWRLSIPDGAGWRSAWGRGEACPVVDLDSRVDTAEEAERRAAIYVAVAAWFRRRPDDDSLLIAVEGM